MTEILNKLDGHPPSAASETLRLDSGSTLLGHISLVIYTAFELEDLQRGFLQYAKDMTEKHGAIRQHLEPEERALLATSGQIGIS